MAKRSHPRRGSMAFSRASGPHAISDTSSRGQKPMRARCVYRDSPAGKQV